ncbi:phytanoyl-CoA dioxygenase family protein [Maribacter arcticus]|uniref:Ectoine hydroxylase-related dioxygenase, phytanoyl-CoA dioxygenase (PhyH) family n=1 Tax=Maribacter arcticus TaxID=561365 RepID=A0A1T5DNC9_9FLAO|nr:phytanoyl-CoA dioxygenase family protein [Maribacter arcticus]SKB73189.1 Ectoine hydroxylase-related dioxygenase, phytanoyl-CoA dioxygenase (PhyH) family [Maribacter arcticus]
MKNHGLIDKPYTLTKDQIDFYSTYRYIKLKNVFDEETLSYFNGIVSKKVTELNAEPKPLDKRDTYGKAFVQLFNLWKEDETIKPLIFSKRLAQIATELMQVDGVRLYHDQALFKEAGGGITPWHADQYYWPLQTDKTVTAWIPLQETPLTMGPLEFSAGSHEIMDGRDLSISDESEKAIQKRLRVTDFKLIIEPFDVGEVSFHSGWVFHRAGANTTQEMRKVMTVIYMDKDMKLKKPSNDGQQNDWDTWCPGVQIGETINSPLNPVLY